MSAPGLSRVLMIAYHFPPLAGSSGIQRTLRFAQHLPRFGWQPLVLTADPRAYERTSEDLNADVPAGTVVRRAFALDTARHLSIGGRYIGATARPDRWVSWRFDAVRVGLQMIREYRPRAIWSTYPIATAHLIGAALHRKSGLPWIADFRDPMAQDGYPADPLTHACFVDIERDALLHAERSMFTTPGAAREYTRRYPDATDRIVVLENGYDEESFALVEADAADRSPLNPGTLTLLHSGIVYRSERDPTQLMQALRLLADDGALTPGRLKIRFRASAHDAMLRAMAAEHGVDAFVELMPPVGYRDALAEMMRADALLVMQASNCNEQVPAKVYEYLRARRPILALTDPAGDTADVLRRSGIAEIARLDDARDIATLLRGFVDGALATLIAAKDVVDASSRLGRTQHLAAELDACARR
jgi:glycosyltransferase involved in cell wall biosynthesis